MTGKMGSDNDIKLKFYTNVSNRHILKVTKFRTHNRLRKKSYGKKCNWGDKIIPQAE